MHSPQPTPRPSPWMPWRYATAVVTLWSAITLTLTWSQHQDLIQLGQPQAFGALLRQYWLATLMQMLYTVATGLVLLRHPQWAARPLRLVLGALATLPVYLVVATPAAVLLYHLGKGPAVADFWAALQRWPALNVYIDAVTAGGVLFLQLGWSFWRHAQDRRQQVLQAQAENLRLRLQMLQGQLEPHFMFNTLNSIAALVRGAERSVALAALSRLSELLRYSLRASQRPWVSVADELGFVADFVALQRLRFGDSLHWQQQLQPLDWARWASPPLLLQPLIDAAIRQGLEAGTLAPVTLALSAQGGRVVLRLSQCPESSSGPGLALLPDVRATLARVQERLAALYVDAADAAALHPAAPGQGFDWQLSWPMRDLDDLCEGAA